MQGTVREWAWICLVIVLCILARIQETDATADDDDAFNTNDYSSLQTSALTPLQGFYVTNNLPVSQLGYAVDSAGDFNNDGYDDIVIGSPYANGNAGVAYVIYGGHSLPKKISISTSGPAEGVGTQITCPSQTYTGYAVGQAGDINGDGIDDILVSVYGQSVVYVVYGNSSMPTAISLSSSTSSSVYTPIVNPDAVNAGYGISVTGVGDVNGDGYNDVLVGEPFFDANRGVGRLFEGPSFHDVVDVLGPTLSSGQVGYAVSGIGDINNDGLPDFAIADPIYNSNDGRIYVVFGNRDVFNYGDNTFQNLSPTGPDPTGFYVDDVPNTGVNTGVSVAAAGDVNGDGIADFIVGAPNAQTGVGAAYVVYGSTSYSANSLDAASLGSAGFAISGVGGDTGSSVAGVGDVNGDGLDDVAVGAPDANAVFIIFGQRTTPGTIYLTLMNSSHGFSIVGPSSSLFGYSVGAAGDVNGDGYADIVVGAPGANLYAGLTYVIYGAASGFVTASPTSSPISTSSMSAEQKANQVVNSTWFRFLYSIVSFIASLIAGYLLRKKIAFRVLSTWGHRFVFLFDTTTTATPVLSAMEIGIKLNARGRPCVLVRGQVVKLVVDDNNGISKGLSDILIKVLTNPLISQQFQLTVAEEIQLRDYLITHKILVPQPVCVCLSCFPELGIFQGTVYAMVLSSFGDAHALYAKKTGVRIDPSVVRESTVGTDGRVSQFANPLHSAARSSDVQLTERPSNNPHNLTKAPASIHEDDDDEESRADSAV